MSLKRHDNHINPVGLVGLGLMGRGIAACLIAHGFKVCAYNRTRGREHQTREHICRTLRDLVRRRVIAPSHARGWEKRFEFVRSASGLAACPFIIESLREDLKLKSHIFGLLEEVAAPDAVIASNTSSLPLTLLQKGRAHPERFIVMHWSEPAWITRFMEIVRNEKTSEDAVERTRQIAIACDKEPSLLNFDIRGFLTNRLMYAFIREACYLVDSGVANVEDIDRSFRNDVGWWAALAGPFRWMDLTGIHSYGQVMEGLLPELSRRKTLPKIMKRMMQAGAQGIANRKGFYPYTERNAKAWEQTWIDFTFDLRKVIKKNERRLQDKGGF
jgi:3-hydroxybutyryl-CoA dehydrogenase